MLCPLFNLLHFIFPCTVVILTWQRQQRENSQKIICVSSCQKNLHILPLISISFVLNWSLYSSLALAVFWLFPRPQWDPSFKWSRFHFCIIEMKHFHWRRESNRDSLLNFDWWRWVCERRRAEQMAVKINYVAFLVPPRFGFVECSWKSREFCSGLTRLIKPECNNMRLLFTLNDTQFGFLWQDDMNMKCIMQTFLFCTLLCK